MPKKSVTKADEKSEGKVSTRRSQSKEEIKVEEDPKTPEKNSNKKVKTENSDTKDVKTLSDSKIEEKTDFKRKSESPKSLVQTLLKPLKQVDENILPREFYTKDVVTLSRELIGKVIVRRYDNKVIKCRIVEAEAYAGAVDKACHAYGFKKTERVIPMYRQGGHIYVYSIYGSNCCLNITASVDGDPSATLIRAVEPIEGMDICASLRKAKISKSGKELTNGPGKVCAAMNIDKSFNQKDCTVKDHGLYIIDDGYTKFEMVTSTRINIDYSEEYALKPWRFYMKDNIFVSVKGTPLNPSEEELKIPPLNNVKGNNQ